MPNFPRRRNEYVVPPSPYAPPMRGGGPKAGLAELIFWAVVVFVGFLACWLIIKMALHIPPLATLPAVYDVGKGVSIYDRTGKHITTVYADRDRLPVPLAKIAPIMQKAVVGAEDHRFYEHHGLDPVGIGRAAVSNLKAGHTREGGSTITQQLVRNLYLDIQDRSFKRKFLEAILSIDVELTNNKNRIMEAYLNEIYFGHGVFGIERAANAYFGIHASELTLPESAFIAGLIRAPSTLSSKKNLPAALERQHQVLEAMVEDKLISQTECDAAEKKKLVFRSTAPAESPAPYYMSAVIETLKSEYSEQQLWQSGLRVYTNMDTEAQDAAEKYLARGIKSAPTGISQGALVTVSMQDGGVLALVGGVGDYRTHQWNRATHPHTAGSSFKPFVYLAALIEGKIQTNTVVEDGPLSVSSGFGQTWTPKNYDGRFLGQITVREALTLSRNTCAVRVGQSVGVDKIIATARAAGITSNLDNNLSISLGSCAVSPLEIANAYATIGRGGVFMPAQLIREIDDPLGNQLKVLANQKTNSLPIEQCLELTDVLQDVVQHGTGTQAKLKDIPVAGKTGTGDQARDIWFVGYTPDAVTAVWGGNDSYKAVGGNVTGGTVMAKIWHDYMVDFYKNHPQPTMVFATPKTPLASKNTPGINANVLNEITQYEEGVKSSDLQTPGEENQLKQQQQAQQEGDRPGQVESDNNQMPPLAPPINGEKPGAVEPGAQVNQPIFGPDAQEQRMPPQPAPTQQIQTQYPQKAPDVMPAPAPAIERRREPNEGEAPALRGTLPQQQPVQQPQLQPQPIEQPENN